MRAVFSQSLRLALLGATLLGAGPAAVAGESHGGGVAGGPAYVRLPPVTITVIAPNNRVSKDVSLQLDLELEPDKTEQNFEPFRRHVTDAFLLTLTGLYDDEYEGGSVPIDVLKAKLLDSVNGVTGPGLVHQVLLIGIGERRARL